LFKRVSLVPNKFDFEAIHNFNQQNKLISGKQEAQVQAERAKFLSKLRKEQAQRINRLKGLEESSHEMLESSFHQDS